MKLIGKYQKLPEVIQRLSKYEEVLLEQGSSLEEAIGLILEEDDYYYDVTPCDAITFASLGVDGIHFAFLTDFGEITNLAEAYIVMIQPMATEAEIVKLVARNISEFLGLIIMIKDANLLADLVWLEAREWESVLNELKTEDWTPANEEIYLELSTFLDLPQIKKPFHYVHQTVFNARQEQITIQTADKIGIVKGNTPCTIEIETLTAQSELTLNRLKTLFQTASTAEKLKYIREAQLFRLLIDQPKITEYFCNALEEEGYLDEALRLREACF